MNTKITQHKMGSNFSLFQPWMDKLLLFPDTQSSTIVDVGGLQGAFHARHIKKRTLFFLEELLPV